MYSFYPKTILCHRLMLAAVALALAGASAKGGVYYVAADGGPQADGSVEKPFRRVQEALDRAAAGDTVRVRPGVYRERVSFKHGGVYGKPVVLEGEQGAILDGSDSGSLNWKPASDIGPGVYRTTVADSVFTVAVNGHLVSTLKEKLTMPGQSRNGPDWEWPKLLLNGHPKSGWKALGALAIYLRNEKQLLVHFENDWDPNTLPISIAPENAPVVSIAKVNRCVVRGLTLRNAAVGVGITDSIGSVVERCVIGPVDEGVYLQQGADRATVRFNEMFWNSYGVGYAANALSWDHWMIVKAAGFSDRHGVKIQRSAGGHEIHDNNIHDEWDGISAKPSNEGEDGGLRVHHNRIVNLMDDGVETAGAQQDCQWYANFIAGTCCAIRIKAPDFGPLYIYRNILWNNVEGIRNFGQKDFAGGSFDKKTGQWIMNQTTIGEPELSPAWVYIYHNTSTSKAAITSNKVYGVGTPNYHYFNNLFWCEFWFSNAPRTQPSIDPNWKGDYNVYVRSGEAVRWADSRTLSEKAGLDAHSVWSEGDAGFQDAKNGNFALMPESPAIGNGVDLSSHLGFPLPGCAAGYFAGGTPDAGALALGSPMPAVPRSPETVNAPAAGTWPGPDADPKAPETPKASNEQKATPKG